MDTTQVAFYVPTYVFKMIQDAAGRQNKAPNVWIREVLFTELQLDVAAMGALPYQRPRLTPVKERILTVLLNEETEHNNRFLTTQQIIAACSCALQSAYINIRDLAREGLIERGLNSKSAMVGGAPCKTYAITEYGKELLSDTRNHAKTLMDAHNQRTQESYDAQVRASLISAGPRYTPEQLAQQKDDAHHNLRFIAIAVAMDKYEPGPGVQLDLQGEHQRLCDNADKAVAAGKTTWAALLTEIEAKVTALGGPDAIKARLP